MKKIFRFAKKKRPSSATPDRGSLLSFGYDLKDKDLGKVHKAAAAGDLEKLKRLAKKNDLNQLDRENRTVLHIACASGHAEVVQLLVESKAKLNLCDNQNRSALMKAVQCQHERCVKILLENHADPNLVDINGNTALHFAAHVSSASTAALLLEHGAEINAQNTEAFTPLTVAVREDHTEMAEFLLKEGADVNFMDQDQRTPLMMAAGNGQISMLRLLLRFDADISLKDNKGWSADDYAVMNGHHPCSLLIIEHSTQRNNGQSMLPHGFNDNSHSESSSRFSKSTTEWSSSEEDELNLSNKKPQKVNLRKMIELKTREASALRVQRIPSLPKASPSSNALQNPVDPSPTSFPSRVSQITSTPHPGCRQSCSENPKMSHEEKQSISTPEVPPVREDRKDIRDTSKRTLPGCRMASPGLEEFPERSDPSEEAQDKDDAVSPPTKPPRSISSIQRLLSPPRQPAPRVRKTAPQKPESEEESDWEPDRLTSSSTTDNFELQHTAELQAVVKPGSSEPSPTTKDSQDEVEPGQQQQKVCKETTGSGAEVQKSSASLDADGEALKDMRAEKPDSSSGFLSSQDGVQQGPLPVAPKRLTAGGRQQNKSPEQTEMAEDFDDITQSSDSATDDMDSPTSGYRHASLLVQKLDSATLDSRSMVKLQNIFHEYERSIQKAKGRHGYLSDKVVVLEMEKAELKRSLEEVKDLKSGLERDQLELQTEVTNLKFQLKQEQENGSNASMMYSSTRDKLRRMEEQQQLEVQEKQKVELSLRNLELEMGALVNNMKQMEEAHRETQRLLDQERSARTLQENLLSSHLRKQQEMEEENRRNMSKSNEALSQLTEASDRERELLQQNASLQEQLNLLKADLERSQATSSLRERHLWEEKEALKEQLEDARRDLQLNSEALTQTGFSCNNQVTSLKSELSLATSRLENERQTRETLQAEAESTRTRLAGAVKEAELCLEARRDAERTLLREKEEHQRLKDRLTGEAASQREAVSSLSQKLSDAEAHSNSMENEVHRVTLQLAEKGLLLDVLQREKDQTTARVKELEGAQQAERELFSRAGVRQEATQERLAQAQSEAMLLRQQLEEAQNKGSAKERAVTDAQERFSDILTKLRSDCEERVQLMEERNKELVGKAAELRDQIYKLEEEKNEREAGLRLLQQELADALKKLSMSEASLEVNTRYRSDLEEEKARLLRDLDRLKGKLEESEDQYVQAEKRINGLKNALDHKEKELTGAAQEIQTALNASAASDTTVRQLEEAVQRLEIENARLEAAAKQQSHKIDALQKGAQEAAVTSDLSPGTGVGKLGLRLAELEKEKGDLSTQVEIEKKKAKKVVEQKKAVDTRLDEEMKRNAELQKETYRMRTLLKTAKKKLRDQDVTGHEFGSPVSSLRTDLGRTGQSEGALGRMKDKVEDLQRQLDREASRRSQLEKSNDDLKDQLASLKGFGQNNEELERSKRQLEEEVLNLRRRLEACQVEQNQLDAYRRDVEERARQDVQQKLDQVNVFLQSQAASQEALDHMRENNEAFLRAQLKQRIQEMEGELDRARTIQRDNLNQRESSRLELEQYQQLYREELRLRKSLEAKLERVNCRLNEANSKLLSERSRSLLTSSLGGPSLHLDSGGSSSNYGVSMSGPVPEQQSIRAEDFLAKMRSELAKNVTQELNDAKVELDSASARLSPVGSASWADLDPVSRAWQEYVEVLMRNHQM
ncbi:ankyrin repeat domain-containing protein 26-like [Antennarius striatus]|uniref:ankyrin repeat domain-containing protein 26-like n=1 Tax=Antennarius striatus TaxID=241820 RepID=UPI0035B4ABFC